MNWMRVQSLIIVFVLLVSAPASFDPVFAEEDQENEPLFYDQSFSANFGNSTVPYLSSHGENLYLSWADDTPGNEDIFLSRSTDGGLTFSEPMNISNSPGSSTYPQVAATDDRVFVVWYDDTPGNEDIFLSRSTDGGLTFSEPMNISNSPGSSLIPRIALSGEDVYIAWIDNSGINFDVYFIRSTNGGESFEEPINISNNDKASEFPLIATVDNYVYLVWHDKAIGKFTVMFSRSTDNGTTFSVPVDLSHNPGGSALPHMTINGSNVYVVWQEDTPGNLDIYFVRSEDHGESFIEAINISNNTGRSIFPQVAVSGRNVYIAWADNTPGNQEILFVRSSFYGSTFSEPVNISNNEGKSQPPWLIASNNSVYMVWYDMTTGNYDIYFSSSSDTGLTFTEALNVSRNHGASLNFPYGSPIIATEDAVFLVWQDRTSGSYEVMMQRIINNGTSFHDVFPGSVQLGLDFQLRGRLVLLELETVPDMTKSIEMRVDDGKIRYVRMDGWDRERVDESTAIVYRESSFAVREPYTIVLITESRENLVRWSITDDNGESRSKGILFLTKSTPSE